MGSTKMKGFLKGIRYISQMFDDEEQEMQIGLPTNVKHVAHIGWDGPSVESPSWMKEFTTKPEASHSAPLDRSGNPIENPELKWGSQDLSSISNSLAREMPDLPKSSRRNSTDNSVTTECDGESCPRPRRTRDPNKPRSSRRHQRKESSEGGGSTSEDQNSADLETSTSKKTRSSGPKKPRRRKPNENKPTSIPPVAYTSPFSDPGPGSNTHNLEQ